MSILTFGASHVAGQQAQAVSAQQGTRPESSARISAGAVRLHLPVKVLAVQLDCSLLSGSKFAGSADQLSCKHPLVW